MFSRRSFLSRSGLAAVSAAAFGAPHIARSAEDRITAPGQKPRRIIHLVSDGMSGGTLTCADVFSQATRQRPLAWMKLFATPGAHQARMSMRSLNSLVTDSAAASSSWGSGSRVVNGALNVLPDGRLLTPLYTLLAENGWARGLVTTAEITHATPAGFAASIRSRDDGQAIAAQYLERKVDVLLGGGRPFFDPAKRRDQRDLPREFATAGYTVVKDRAGLEGAPVSSRLLGLFAESHLPYTIDQSADPKLQATVPTLVQMTTVALARLELHEQFFLQVEGARIDHAAHNSDAAAAIHDQLAFDDALSVCLEFQKRHPETLIVVTTDHGNSNLGLNGMGGGYRHSSQRFAALAAVKASYPEILKRLQSLGEKIQTPALAGDEEDRLEIPDPMAHLIPAEELTAQEDTRTIAASHLASALRVEPKVIIDVIAESTGYRMSTRRAELFARVLAGEYQALYDQMNVPVTQLGQLMANRLGIGWTGNTHTADYVPVTAFGPGAERFTGFLQNTDIFSHYTQLAGIDFKNPDSPLIAGNREDACAVERPESYASADGSV